MPADRPLPLWRGRVVALAAIILLALNLRTAVAAISPIAEQIGVDVELTSVSLGLIGMLPPVLFATAGFIAPVIARRIGFEATLVIAISVMIVGHLSRSLADGFLGLFLGSAAALIAMGMGNILMPPVVKRYFPDRIGLVTALYFTLMSISTAVPAVLAVPIADTLGWRLSVGVWSVLAAMALIPWIALLAGHRRAMSAAASEDSSELPQPGAVSRLWRSPIALALSLAMAVSSLSAYACFAWLPTILGDTAGTTTAGAGALLALFSVAGFPAGIIAPMLVQRLRNPGWIVQGAVVLFVVGYLGLLLAPSVLTWLWVLLVGSGTILFPVTLALINTRTTSTQNSASLSGFVQGIGYTVGATGPLIVGVLHDSTGGWTVPLIALLVTSLSAIVAGIVLARPGTVEDELERHRPRGST